MPPWLRSSLRVLTTERNENMENILDFISPSDTLFYESESGLLCLKYKGEDMGRISVLRMFPFMYEEEYLCIKSENYSREDMEKEIGVLRTLAEIPENQLKMVRRELAKRYFVPEITEVVKVSEEFGHTMWEVTTTAGVREFTVTDMSSNVRNMGNNRVMLTDVYGNRYYIPDITKVEDKALKILEIWI